MNATDADLAAIEHTALDYIEGFLKRNGRWLIVNVLWEMTRPPVHSLVVRRRP